MYLQSRIYVQMHTCGQEHTVWHQRHDATEGMLLSFVFLLERNNLKVVFANFDPLQSSENYYLYGNSDLLNLHLVKCSQMLHLVPCLCKVYFRVYNQTVSNNTIFIFYNLFCLWVCAQNLVSYTRHQYLYFQQKHLASFIASLFPFVFSRNYPS